MSRGEWRRPSRRDFIHDVGDAKHHVFLRYGVDHRGKGITVVGLVRV